MTYGLLNMRRQPKITIDDLYRYFGNPNDEIAPTVRFHGDAPQSYDWNNIFRILGVPRNVVPNSNMTAMSPNLPDFNQLYGPLINTYQA